MPCESVSQRRAICQVFKDTLALNVQDRKYNNALSTINALQYIEKHLSLDEGLFFKLVIDLGTLSEDKDDTRNFLYLAEILLNANVPENKLLPVLNIFLKRMMEEAPKHSKYASLYAFCWLLQKIDIDVTEQMRVLTRNQLIKMIDIVHPSQCTYFIYLLQKVGIEQSELNALQTRFLARIDLPMRGKFSVEEVKLQIYSGFFQMSKSPVDRMASLHTLLALAKSESSEVLETVRELPFNVSELNWVTKRLLDHLALLGSKEPGISRDIIFCLTCMHRQSSTHVSIALRAQLDKILTPPVLAACGDEAKRLIIALNDIKKDCEKKMLLEQGIPKESARNVYEWSGGLWG